MTALLIKQHFLIEEDEIASVYSLISSDIKLDKEQSATHFLTVLKPPASSSNDAFHDAGVQISILNCMVLPVLYLHLLLSPHH